MGEKIQFPGNYQHYYDLGKTAFDAQDYPKAITNFTQAYELKPNYDLNILFVYSLMETKAYEEALELAKAYEDDYLKRPDLGKIYISLLLINQQFYQANQLYFQYRQKGTQDQKTFWDATKQRITQEEQKYLAKEEGNIQQLKKSLFHLSDHELGEQIHLLHTAEKLPKSVLLAVGPELLTDPYLHPLVIGQILDELRRLNDLETRDLLWFDTRYQVIPAELNDIFDSKSYRIIENGLVKELGQSDPIKLQQLTDEVNLHFSYVYPFADKFFEQPEKWLKAYLQIGAGDAKIDDEIWAKMQQLEALSVKLYEG